MRITFEDCETIKDGKLKVLIELLQQSTHVDISHSSIDDEISMRFYDEKEQQ